MANPTSTSERQVRRWAVAPDRLLAWLGVVGLACYGTLWLVHQAFYSQFGVSVFMVGLGQAQMVTTAAVLALWFVPLLAYPVVLARFLFSMKPPRGGRAPVLEAALGAVLLLGTLMLLREGSTLRNALRPTDGEPSGFLVLAVFVGMAGMLSLALLSRGTVEILTFRFGYPLIRPAVKWWMLRRYLGRAWTPEAIFTTYLPARRASRQRAVRRRAHLAPRRTARRSNVPTRATSLARAGVLPCRHGALPHSPTRR
jgi:hypothetical protein